MPHEIGPYGPSGSRVALAALLGSGALFAELVAAGNLATEHMARAGAYGVGGLALGTLAIMVGTRRV